MNQQSGRTDNAGSLRSYEPDFVVLTSEGTHSIVETKGLENVNGANQDRAAQLWCENTTALTGKAWAHLKVFQTACEESPPSTFADLVVLIGAREGSGRQTSVTRCVAIQTDSAPLK